MSVRETIDPDSSLWAWLAFDLWFHRTRRGLSLAQTAQIVRVARGTVSNWEAGRLRPGEQYMVLLDKAWDTGGHFQRLRHYAITGHDPDWLCDVKSHVSSECMIGGRWKVGMHSRLV
ncbi:helix-turn-helix domain-containing protein, partial [Actinomadura geliboluensis]|uniref:helix-turn-helix domain-containing protein n=1 Tax=Actinomadura geliboluensis TaxID=882440 RepID=UPI00371C1611